MHTDGRWIKDEAGRRLILRGANLGGSAKVPSIRAADPRKVSFVGRPLPLAEADEHYARLRSWGLTFLRFVVTWEAVEHAGPGQYDGAYLDYLEEVVTRAGEHGLQVFIDPHQDVWSRWTGGDGAPAWTLEAVGMDLTRLEATGAAIAPDRVDHPLPPMIWPTNYDRLAAATMFTLFFGGDHYAPQLEVDGEPVQAFLQRHYIAAMAHIARRLAPLPAVVGFGTLNEPGTGYIARPNLASCDDYLLRCGPTPTPLDSMLCGAGHARRADYYELTLTGPRKTGRVTVNPGEERLWRDGHDCPWERHGVWGYRNGRPELLRPDYFARYLGQPVQFSRDYLKPFLVQFTQQLRCHAPQALFFAEGPPRGEFPAWTVEDGPNVVDASHWYDVMQLFLKRFDPRITAEFDGKRGHLVLGRRRVAELFARQLAQRKSRRLPTFFGEFGVAFDMGNGRSYRSGDYSAQSAALSTYLDAMDHNLAGCALWNYTPDNNNRDGDGWNGEDLSIFSRDQQHDPSDIHSGGRAVEGFCRPYARAIAGTPRRMNYDRHSRRFTLVMDPDPSVDAPTEICIPRHPYPRGYAVTLSAGHHVRDEANDRLLVSFPTSVTRAVVTITPAEKTPWVPETA